MTKPKRNFVIKKSSTLPDELEKQGEETRDRSATDEHGLPRPKKALKQFHWDKCTQIGRTWWSRAVGKSKGAEDPGNAPAEADDRKSTLSAVPLSLGTGLAARRAVYLEPDFSMDDFGQLEGLFALKSKEPKRNPAIKAPEKAPEKPKIQLTELLEAKRLQLLFHPFIISPFPSHLDVFQGV